ncbi:hypothetical protein [Rhodopila sp.]|uniref:hypothetical protein n=1 Tax=Rhodopila sp. TaxID=2480087 RepID=UPI003D09EBD3
MSSTDAGIPHLEMTFPKKIVEQKYRAHEETMNAHLVKLLAFEVDNRTRTFWKKEILNHVNYLSDIRSKGQGLVRRRDAFMWLYSDPFGGNEETYVAALIRMADDDDRRNSRSTEDIAARIQVFHEQVADALANGIARADVLDDL